MSWRGAGALGGVRTVNHTPMSSLSARADVEDTELRVERRLGTQSNAVDALLMRWCRAASSKWLSVIQNWLQALSRRAATGVPG